VDELDCRRTDQIKGTNLLENKNIKESKKILVTGGAGRLGSIVCRKMLAEGYRVRVLDLDNKRNRKTTKDLSGNADIFWGDVTDKEQVIKALDGIDVVVHMAAILPPWAYINPNKTFKVNAEGTRNIVEAVEESGRNIPFIYTSSAAAFGPTPDATEPLCPDKTVCKPRGAYGESKHKAEQYVKGSGIDYLILRLTATMYLSFEFSDFKRMFSIPLNNRVEYCHPYDTAQAIVNSIDKFDEIKGNTLIIAGGPEQQMIYKDMVSRMLSVYGLPLPPESKFTKIPYYLDWYDTAKSQLLLKFQKRTFQNFIDDLSEQVDKRYTTLFIPIMRKFIGPLFGKLIVRSIQA
jgi:UDP-glucose 4-epimerase